MNTDNARTHPTPLVLLVEDSQDDVYFFSRALKKSGLRCQFIHVSDGGAAVELLKAAEKQHGRHPDFIFLDLKMPVLNGFEVLEWIQRTELSRRPDVTVLSGSDQEEDRERAARLGAADYLVKPISPQDLMRRVQSAETSTLRG